MEQTNRDPWGIFVGSTIASLAVILLLSSCNLPDLDVGAVVPNGLPAAGGEAVSGGKADDPQSLPDGDPAPDQALATAAEASVDADDETDEAVAFLNGLRARAGLASVQMDTAATQGAQWHADYLWLNRDVETSLSAHEEDGALAGFSGVHYWERLEAAGVDLAVQPALGEVIATHPRAVSAVQHWMETAYHRLPLLAPEATAVGYGHVVSAGYATNVMDLVARPASESRWPPIVLYPPPEESGVRPWWDGLESPRPPAPPGGFPSGPVISVSSLHGVEIAVDEHTLQSADGVSIPHVFLTAENDPNLDRASAVVLYANAPLAPGKRYVVHVAGTAGGVGFDETWSFETTPHDLDCRPGAARCGPGRGCYHLTDPLTCEFEGVLPERAPCLHANDCADGLTCFRGACQAYCALDSEDAGGLSPCADRCAWGHLPLPVSAGGLGLCLPPPCDPHGDECGPERWCTWGGAFVCDSAGTRPEGNPCESTDACVEGTSCLDLGDGFRCHALCATDKANGSALASCSGACPGAARAIDTAATVAVCP